MYAIKISVIIACLLHVASSSDTSYKDNGDSWAKDPATPVCARGWSQSPIDLSTKMRSREEKYFIKHYENVMGDDKTKSRFTDPNSFGKVVGESYFSTHSSAIYAFLDNKDLGQANVPIATPTDKDNFHNANWFKSSGGSEIFEADPMYFAKQLHFHTKSEHTINGELKDLEMHIVHQSPNTTADKYKSQDATVQELKWPLGKLAVIGVLFDTKNYDNVTDETVGAIDSFFDSLDIEKHLEKSGGNYQKQVLDDIALGQLMGMLNTTNRWIYNGSLTTPPCYEYVFWNVLQTVYPIKEKHFNQYMDVLKGRANSATDSIENGNYRKARAVNEEHNLISVRPLDIFVPKDTEKEQEIMLIIIAVFVIASIYLVFYIIYKKVQARRADQIVPNDVEMSGKYSAAKDDSTIFNNATQEQTEMK